VQEGIDARVEVVELRLGAESRQAPQRSYPCGVIATMTPQELRDYAMGLLVTLGNGPDERRGAAELLAALADWNPELLRRAAIGETGDGNAPRELLLEAVEIADDESD